MLAFIGDYGQYKIMWKDKDKDTDGIIDAEIDETGEFRFVSGHRKFIWQLKNRARAIYMLIIAASFLATYLAFALLPIAAIFSFFYIYSDWWMIFAIPAALIVAVIPVLGFMIGVFAAHAVWGWAWWLAILLFCWPLIFKILFKNSKRKFKFAFDYRRPK